MPLQYHYEEDRRDWVLMGHDLYPHKRSIQTRANIFFAVALIIDVALIAWPVAAMSVWGFEQAVLTFAFFVHLIKALLLLCAIVSETSVYKMYGRRNYAFFWGLWTRRSHVRSNTSLSIYGFVYGWIQIPVMITYIVLSITAYPLFISNVLYWTQWPMGFVSISSSYFAWCVVVSEMAIRRNLEQYVAFGPNARRAVARMTRPDY